MTRPRLTCRRCLQAALALVALAAVVAFVWLTWPESLESRVKRIRPGMTRAEVDALIAAPPEKHTVLSVEVRPGGPVPDSEEDVWFLEDGSVFVKFDDADLVRYCRFEPNLRPPTLWGRLRARLPW